MTSPFAFEGRTGRLAYVVGLLFYLLLLPMTVFFGCIIALAAIRTYGWIALVAFLALIGVLIACFWIVLVLHARRGRDIGWNPYRAVVIYLVIWSVETQLAYAHPFFFKVGIAANLIFFMVMAVWPPQQPDAFIPQRFRAKAG